MKKRFSYLLLIVALLFTAVISINALEVSDINVDNNNASFSKIYEKLEDANKAITDFETYVKENKGVVVSTKTDKIINEINEEILNGVIEGDTLSELDSTYKSLQEHYDGISNDNEKYEVVLGNVETIETETVDYEYESGKVGEYTNPITAYIVSRMVEAYENRDDYEFRTRIERERRVVNTIIANLNGSFDTERSRNLFLFGFTLAGYDLSNVNVYETTVTDVTNETKEFASFDERDEYIASLEREGYRVSHDLNSIRFDEVEEDYTEIDEDFDSIASLNDYIRNIDQNYNHKDINITDNSYDEITDEVRTQDGFETEAAAQEYIDSFKNDYRVFNEKVTSYETTDEVEENNTEYYTSEAAANDALSRVQDVVSSSVRKLSLDEIDMNQVLEGGNTNLDPSNRRFNYLSADLTTRINVNGRMENATVAINSVTVDGNRYSLITSGRINNNSKITVSGTITYCRWGGFFGTLCIPTSSQFYSEGILNSNNNRSITQNLFFQYGIDSAILNGDGSVTVYDNLEDIYQLDYTTKKIVTKTLYKAEANIYRVDRIESYNVNGYASNIVKNPVYIVDITKEKDRLVYNVDGTAKYDIYDNFYIIYYDAVRTVRDTLISYKQDYTVNKTTTNITYLAEGTARLNIEDKISAPNTGVDTNNSNYLYLLLVLIPLGYVSIKKLVK